MRDFCWAFFLALMLFSYFISDEIEQLERIEARLPIMVGLETCLPRARGRGEKVMREVWRKLRNKLRGMLRAVRRPISI